MYAAPMEIRLVIFLAFTSVAVFANTLLIWFAYKRFATAASVVTETLMGFETSDAARTWLRSMQAAAEDAVNVTEIAKHKMADGETYFAHAKERYGLALVKVDSQLEKIGDQLSAGAQKMKDSVAKPASSIVSFTAGVSQILKIFTSKTGE